MRGQFRDELNTKADALKASFGLDRITTHKRVAYSETVDEIIQGARAVRILDGIVRNKYHGNPGKLAAWTSASHVEKAPRAKKNEQPTPLTSTERATAQKKENENVKTNQYRIFVPRLPILFYEHCLLPNRPVRPGSAF